MKVHASTGYLHYDAGNSKSQITIEYTTNEKPNTKNILKKNTKSAVLASIASKLLLCQRLSIQIIHFLLLYYSIIESTIAKL